MEINECSHPLAIGRLCGVCGCIISIAVRIVLSK